MYCNKSLITTLKPFIRTTEVAWREQSAKRWHRRSQRKSTRGIEMARSPHETSLSLTEYFNRRAATGQSCQRKSTRESLTRSKIKQSQRRHSMQSKRYRAQRGWGCESSCTCISLLEQAQEAQHSWSHGRGGPHPLTGGCTSAGTWEFCHWCIPKSALSVYGPE